MASKLALLLPADYVSDAAAHIRRATHRVTFLSMILDDDPTSDELIDALSEAASRGITVEMAADVFTYAELGGFLFPTQYKPNSRDPALAWVNALLKVGSNLRGWDDQTQQYLVDARTSKCVL
jgi:phosphatidylserine/phosphatidylglycerophosphate/cardiolipin synthase-like enzyme